MQHNDDEHRRFGVSKSKKETWHAGKKEEENKVLLYIGGKCLVLKQLFSFWSY